MMITMKRNVIIASVAGGISCALILMYLNKNKTKKLLRYIWDGDAAGEERREIIRNVEAILHSWENNNCFVRVAKTLSSIENDTDIAMKHVASKAEKKRENPSTNDPSSPNSAAAASSYYHFDSKGNKFRSKWDTFDVDAELEALDEPEDKSVSVAKRKSELQRELSMAHEELWRAQESVDGIIVGDDEEIRSQRKKLNKRLDDIMDVFNKLRERFQALQTYPQFR